jgi:hypothetical protein
MPYVSFREQAGESGEVNGSFQRAYRKTFIITVDSATDSVFYVGSHPQLPKIFDAHPADPKAFCVNLAPSQDGDNPLIWRVTATYSYTLDAGAGAGGIPATGVPAIDSQQQGKPPADRQTVPLARGNDYSYATTPMGTKARRSDTRETYTDKNGKKQPKPMVNHPILKDPINPYPTYDEYALMIRVGRNMPGAPNLEWLSLNGKLNANRCTIGTHICEPGTARMMNTSAELVYEESVSYWRWTHEIILRPDPEDWMYIMDSQGVNAIVPMRTGPDPAAPTKDGRQRIADFNRSLSGPQILTEEGKIWALNQNDPVQIVKYNYLEWATFPTVL